MRLPGIPKDMKKMNDEIEKIQGRQPPGYRGCVVDTEKSDNASSFRVLHWLTQFFINSTHISPWLWPLISCNQFISTRFLVLMSLIPWQWMHSMEREDSSPTISILQDPCVLSWREGLSGHLQSHQAKKIKMASALPEVPKQHKAVICEKPGTISTQVLSPDTQEPGPGEVLINLRAMPPSCFLKVQSPYYCVA